jgi:hypothetical protein
LNNIKQAKQDEDAAIDAAIKATSAFERVKNAQTYIDLQYELCMTRLSNSIKIALGDQACENEAKSAYEEATLSTEEQMKILENQH